jgi:hypothetical protein
MIFTHLLSPLFALVIASAPVLAQSQVPINYDQVHNATVITGTWSSGSQGVLTGSVRSDVYLVWWRVVANDARL